MTTLFDTTRDLHHACELHPVGGSMSDGSILKQWWADWLSALYQIHRVIDGDSDIDDLSRIQELNVDLKACSINPRYNCITRELVKKLKESERYRMAARYVITGAHLMGGQVTRKRIAGRLPSAHLHYGNRKQLMNEWLPYRQKTELTQEARRIFQYLLWIMDEILMNDIDVSFKDFENNEEQR
jgi:hypothetical protein